NGGKNSLNRLIRCVCGKKIGPDPRNFNQRVSLGRNDLLIRTFPSVLLSLINSIFSQRTYLGNILADYHCAKYCAECRITNLFHEYEIVLMKAFSPHHFTLTIL
ncbi:hypothetical protein, partial [Klebsiella pneumoniae]|uniref:hypothetical protein n=1 Tax=Klebsiella pneumoniae TaxID=573 RepID=UPI001BD0140A